VQLEAQAIPAPARGEESILYGDSTPFPYELDFLETIRAVVECGVALLSSQAAIDRAVGICARAEEKLRGDRARLGVLVESVRKVTVGYDPASRMAAPAAEVLEATRLVVEREQAAIDREAAASDGDCSRVVDDACAAAYQALERFLLHHVAPPTRMAWRLQGDDSGYDALVHLRTAFGLDAHFTAGFPDRHPLSSARRAGELCDDVVVSVPRPLRLDRWFLSEAVLDPERMSLVLRRSVTSGRGQRIEIVGATEQATLQPLDENNKPTAGVCQLDGADRLSVLRLGSAVLEASLDLPFRRQVMVHASLNGHSLRQRHEPREVATRLLAAFAPVVREIDRRSGAPGELMLRRDLGNGRRETVFIKKLELLHKLLVLPNSLRVHFAPLGLLAR
jgi:hypothetical protein